MLRALPFPKRINVELTNHCNQRCPLCPRQGFTRPLGFMDVDLFDRIARECAPHDTALWLHFLGEPLLHPHAPAMIERAKRAGVRQIGLSTNAVSLSGRRAEALLDGGLDRLECSVDSLDREGFVAMRGRDHFEKVVRNVRVFLQLKRARGLDKPVTSIQLMRTPAVETTLPQIVAEWKPFLGRRDFIMTIRPFPFGGAIDIGADGSPRPANGRPPCPWLFESLLILQDGTVVMCNVDWDAKIPLGNLADSAIRELWTGAEMQRRRAAHRQGRFEAVGPCAACEDWKLADGHGYANALDEVESRLARPDASESPRAAGYADSGAASGASGSDSVREH